MITPYLRWEQDKNLCYLLENDKFMFSEIVKDLRRLDMVIRKIKIWKSNANIYIKNNAF